MFKNLILICALSLSSLAQTPSSPGQPLSLDTSSRVKRDFKIPSAKTQTFESGSTLKIDDGTVFNFGSTAATAMRTALGDVTGTKTFTNDANRAATTPAFIGQLGFQRDTLTFYYGSALTLGAWVSEFGFDSITLGGIATLYSTTQKPLQVTGGDGVAQFDRYEGSLIEPAVTINNLNGTAPGLRLTGNGTGTLLDVYKTGVKQAEITVEGLTLAGWGTVGAPGLSFYGDSDSGFYRSGANTIGVATNGANVATFSMTGFSVTGTITAGGAFTGTTATYSGLVTAANFTTAGTVTAVTGTYSGTVTGANLTTGGTVTGVTGSYSGTLTAANLTTGGTVTGVAGAFSGGVSGTTGTFSAGLSGTTGTFTGLQTVTISGTATAVPITALMPSIIGGNGVYVTIGQALSNYNSASFGFVFGSSGSTSNYLGFSLYGQAVTAKIYSTGISPGATGAMDLGDSGAGWKRLYLDKTVTAGGTTGAQTINKTAGTVNFAAAATSLVVTNSLVTTSSIIVCTVGTVDSTMKTVVAVAAAGSFTLTSNAAATAETRVNFLVIN